MIVDEAVAQFMDDDVIDAVNWGLHEFRIEKDVSGLRATPPAVRHSPNSKVRKFRQPERW